MNIQPSWNTGHSEYALSLAPFREDMSYTVYDLRSQYSEGDSPRIGQASNSLSLRI